MGKKVVTRLQGNDWQSEKDSLEFMKLEINKNGHYKGYYTDIQGNVYSHWLNDDEILQAYYYFVGNNEKLMEQIKQDEKVLGKVYGNSVDKY